MTLLLLHHQDIYFCMKARNEAGARVFVDTRIKLGHIGAPNIIDEEYRDEWAKTTGEDTELKAYKYNQYEK